MSQEPLQGWDFWAEPPSLEPLIHIHQQVLVAVLSWVKPQLVARLGARADGVTFDVIEVEYSGSYPVLAFRLPAAVDRFEFAKLCEAEIEQILADTPVTSFLQFVGHHRRSWTEVREDLRPCKPAITSDGGT